jgi:hypothetical protein
MDNNNIEQTRHLKFDLGTTLSHKLKSLAAVKNAMTAAIMCQLNEDTITKESEDFEVYQSLYLEAKFMEQQLQKI